jgi:hypothetical protein
VRLRKAIIVLSLALPAALLWAAGDKLGPFARSSRGPFELVTGVAGVLALLLAPAAMGVQLPPLRSRRARSTSAQRAEALTRLRQDSRRAVAGEIARRELDHALFGPLRWLDVPAGRSSHVDGPAGLRAERRFPLTITLDSPIELQPGMDIQFGVGALAAVITWTALSASVNVVVAAGAAVVAFLLVLGVSRLAEVRLRDGEITMDVAGLLARLRTTALVGMGCYALATAILLSAEWPRLGLAIPMMSLAAALVPMRQSIWTSFTATRVEIALTRELPWRLMSFLRDCTTLGVLRPTGPSYRFRHDLLRTALADPRPDGQPSVAAPSVASKQR